MEPAHGHGSHDDLQLGLHEALVNAVRHGNGCDPSKCLRVRRIVTTHWLVWQVQDEGPGLPTQVRTKVKRPSIEAVSGRGLFLIQHCFDDVRWSPRGNRLQLAVRRRRLSGRGKDNQDP